MIADDEHQKARIGAETREHLLVGTAREDHCLCFRLAAISVHQRFLSFWLRVGLFYASAPAIVSAHDEGGFNRLFDRE